MQPIISKSTMEALLGRSLTTVEDNNYTTYLNLAVARILDLLCLEELPDPLQIDLQLLIARCFDLLGQEQAYEKNGYKEISSKKVEDFSVTYGSNYRRDSYEPEETLMSKFIRVNMATIAKYSQCSSQSQILHGELCYGDSFRFI